MKFGKELQQKMVPEWNTAYLNYTILKKLLGPYKEITKLYMKTKYQHGVQNMVLINHDIQDLADLKEFGEIFEKILIAELDKINAFFQFKLMDFTRKQRYIKKNIDFMKTKQLARNFEDLSSELQFGIHQFYKELKLLDEYLKINQKAIKKLIKKHNKSLKLFDERNLDHFYNHNSSFLSRIVEKKMRDSFINRNQKKLDKMIKELEESYLQFYFSRFNKRQGEKQLKQQYEDKAEISSQQLFYFGLFFGCALILLAFIIIEFVFGTLENHGETDHEKQEISRFQKSILQSFRGVSLFILYMWLLGWNAKGWNSYNVNYKLIFKFNHHFSTVQQILRRAAFFTCMLMIMYIWFYLLQNYKDVHPYLGWIPASYTPLVVWICLIGYMFYPSYQVFNGPGRKYFYKLMYLCLFNSFYPMEFRIAWATDQIVSFVGPLKDLQFTICFYTSNFTDEKDTSPYKTCGDDKTLITGFIMAFLPLLFRMMQCARQGYDNGKFWRTEYFYNFLKYSCSVMVAIFSYLYKVYNDSQPLFILWIFFAVSSVLYSYYWDLKNDWGFLQSDNKSFTVLRKQLSYHNPSIYYIAMTSNLILRCTWVLSISPDTYEKIGFGHNKILFTFVISFLEMFRRCQWNFFRVEKEHIKNQTAYKAVEDMSLPINIMEEKGNNDIMMENPNTQVVDQDNKNVQDQSQSGSNIQYQQQQITNQSHQLDLNQTINRKASDDTNRSTETLNNNQIQQKQNSIIKSLEESSLSEEDNQQKKQLQRIRKDDHYPNYYIVDQTRMNFQNKLQTIQNKFDQKSILKKVKHYKNKMQEKHRIQRHNKRPEHLANLFMSENNNQNIDQTDNFSQLSVNNDDNSIQQLGSDQIITQRESLQNDL